MQENNNSFVYSLHSYKLPEKFEYSYHMHDFFELIYLIHGNAIYSNENKTYRLNKGDLVITRPFSYHCITFHDTEIYTRANILFDANNLPHPSIVSCADKLDVVNCNYFPAISDIMKMFEYYNKNMSTEDFTQVAALLVEQIFWTLKNVSDDNKLSAADILDENHILSPVIRYINENLSTLGGIEELCKTQHISESYLHKLFKNTFKMTPAKYIHTKRLFYAKQMLELGKKPTEICYQCGYKDYSTFYRNYVKLFGVAPMQKIELSSPYKQN